jgi:integrase
MLVQEHNARTARGTFSGVKVEAVDPLFLEPGARHYVPEEQGGAQKIAERSLAVKLYRNDGANGLHLKKLDAKELEKIKAAKDASDGKLVAVGTIYYRIARLPLGFAALLGEPPSDSLRAKRDRAILALLVGCGLRRAELVGLGTEDFQVREEHWVIADLIGKGKHIRTVPVPVWAKRAVDEWIMAAGINGGAIFRRVSRLGKIWGDSITPKAIWHVVKAAAKRAGIKDLAPHDLRRTCARLCHLAGGELEQIQFLLGHASVQTTERYLGCKQRISQAVNDNLGLEDT